MFDITSSRVLSIYISIYLQVIKDHFYIGHLYS